MLQELLNLGLVEIGADDSRFEKMLSASSALAKRFYEKPDLLIPATLIALDEDVDEDDPFFTLVEEIVTAEWKTLRNTHSNRPRQLLRSVAIDALETSSAESAEVSSIIWNTAAPLIRHQQLRLGKASGLIQQLLDQTCERAETEAIKLAGMSAPPSKRKNQKPSSGPAKLKLNGKINDKEVLNDVACAAGPQYPNGQVLADANPHWPNTGGPWSLDFIPRMTAALVKAVNLGTSRLAESIAKDLEAYVAAIEGHMLDQFNAAEQLQVEMAQSNAASRMRIDVLWWSEARYSPLLKRGYRELAPPIGALISAIDLAHIVPRLAPASISYVLAETVAGIFQEAHQSSQPIEQYLKSVSEASLDLQGELPRASVKEGRVPLVELVAEAAAGTAVSTDKVRARTGIEANLSLTPADFAMWMFREIQALRMVEGLS